MLVNKDAQWVTMPIARSYSGFRLINEMKIDDTKPWREDMMKTIKYNYSGCDYFTDIYKFVETLLSFKTDDLTKFNLNAIEHICDLLEINTSKFVMGSSLKSTGSATELLVSIIKELNGDSYMCGGGAAKYQEDELFQQYGIKLIYQNFKHQVYKQKNTTGFIPGLSVIDALMNCGRDEVMKMVMSNK